MLPAVKLKDCVLPTQLLYVFLLDASGPTSLNNINYWSHE